MRKQLEKIAQNREILTGLLKNPENRKVMERWLKTELAYTSNAIEGNTLTRRETALVIEEDMTSRPRPVKDYLEARNHAKAFGYICEEAQRRTPLSEDVVLRIHRLILCGIDDLNAGFYRSVRVRISGSPVVLPNPLKVPQLMKEFGEWLAENKELPEICALEAHYRLVTIHPFVDGNGRTARLLMNLILLKNGIPPLIIRPIDRRRYLSAIEARQTGGADEGYFKFMLAALNRSLKTVIGLLDTEKGDVPATKLLTIAGFAKLAGVPVSTVRYRIQAGKLTPAAYTDSGYALFAPEQAKDIR